MGVHDTDQCDCKLGVNWYVIVDVMDEKKTLRKAYILARQQLSQSYRAEADQRICQSICEFVRKSKAKIVCGYWAIRSEPDLSPVFHPEFWGENMVKTALPVIVEGTKDLKFIHWNSGQKTVSNRFGINEPPLEGSKIIRCFADAIVIIPALAMDQMGYRLGYGGGYYDRLLAKNSVSPNKFTSVGVCYHQQFVPRLPTEVHDQKLDCVITDFGVQVNTSSNPV